jgi:hypothetical protein
MWSGPRNISTTMMRAFEARGDCHVVDEPFYACYLQASGADHPYRDATLAVRPADCKDVIRGLAASLPQGKTVLFAKHIAYHYPDDEPLDWLDRHRSFILIRDPRRMIASYARKYDDVAPILDSFRVARRIREFEAARGRPCPVVDADDVLADPPGLLRRLCAALDIPYTDRMLAWPAGPRASDGPWAPHWYDAVNASTGFRSRAAPAANSPPGLDGALGALAALCRPAYDAFWAERLRAD